MYAIENLAPTLSAHGKGTRDVRAKSVRRPGLAGQWQRVARGAPRACNSCTANACCYQTIASACPPVAPNQAEAPPVGSKEVQCFWGICPARRRRSWRHLARPHRCQSSQELASLRRKHVCIQGRARYATAARKQCGNYGRIAKRTTGCHLNISKWGKQPLSIA